MSFYLGRKCFPVDYFCFDGWLDMITMWELFINRWKFVVMSVNEGAQ